MNGTLTLYLDQYGGRWFARSVRDLQRQIGGRVGKMYRDTSDGRTLHIGYVVGRLWCSAFRPFEVEA